MPSVTTDTKALRYLAGRIRALHVDAAARTATFRVLGSSETPYTVVYDGGIWSCTCPARVADCAHVKACALVSAPAPAPTPRASRATARRTRTLATSEVRAARRRDVATYAGAGRN